jgi:hypothetical protein
MRGTISAVRRLVDPAVGLRPPSGSTSRMRCYFVMVDIVLTSPTWMSQEIVNRPSATYLQRIAHGSSLGESRFTLECAEL